MREINVKYYRAQQMSTKINLLTKECHRTEK